MSRYFLKVPILLRDSEAVLQILLIFDLIDRCLSKLTPRFRATSTGCKTEEPNVIENGLDSSRYLEEKYTILDSYKLVYFQKTIYLSQPNKLRERS